MSPGYRRYSFNQVCIFILFHLFFLAKQPGKNKGIIKNFYPVIDTFKLGYEGYRIYINLQYTNPNTIKSISNYFIKYPLNWWTISSEGRFDLAVILWVNHINKFYSYWDKTLQLYRDYFREQQFSIYIQSYSFLNEFLNPNYDENGKQRKAFILSGEKKSEKII